MQEPEPRFSPVPATSHSEGETALSMQPGTPRSREPVLIMVIGYYPIQIYRIHRPTIGPPSMPELRPLARERARERTLGVTSHVLRSLRFRLVLACLSCSSRRTESFDFHLKLRHSILNYSRKACVNAWCKKQLEESAGKIHKPENEKRGVSAEA